MLRLLCLALASVIASSLHAASTLAPERIYAQELVNQTVASHAGLLVVAKRLYLPHRVGGVINR